MQLRYGTNPHQEARAVLPADGLPAHGLQADGMPADGPPAGQAPIQVIHGEPSYINLLDALNAWFLVREAAAATGLPAAASFKHVSPAGVAVAGPLDAAAQQAWRLGPSPGALTAAYVRSRDADPKSSFGDMIAVSEPVDTELAEFVAGVVSDGMIAPDYLDGAVGILAPKKHGTFLLMTADPGYEPPAWEQRDVYGVVLAQERDRVPLTPDLLSVVSGPALPPHAVRDALLGLAAVRYTQSNSVALVAGGAAVGIGAGQQNRVDCVRLAATKSATWWLRRHEHIRNLAAVPGMLRQDRLNWQIRMAEADMTPRQLAEFAALFPGTEPYLDEAERNRWLARLDSVTLSSDGFLPFRDNIDHASRAGVRYVVEPGVSSRSDEVTQACEEYGMTLVRTGLRLFHH